MVFAIFKTTIHVCDPFSQMRNQLANCDGPIHSYIHVLRKKFFEINCFHGLLHECMSILPLTIIDRAKPQFHNRRKQVSGLWRALRYNLGLKCSYMLIVHVYLTPEMTTVKDVDNMSRSQDSTMLDDQHLLPDSNYLLRRHGRKKINNWRRDHILIS